MLNDARFCRYLPRLNLTYEARHDLDVSVCSRALLVGAMTWNSEEGRKKTSKREIRSPPFLRINNWEGPLIFFPRTRHYPNSVRAPASLVSVPAITQFSPLPPLTLRMNPFRLLASYDDRNRGLVS